MAGQAFNGSTGVGEGYWLCATATGIGTGTYEITMIKNIQEYVGMQNSPTTVTTVYPPKPTSFCLPPGNSCPSGYGYYTEILNGGDNYISGYTDCVPQTGAYSGSVYYWNWAAGPPPLGEVMCFQSGTVDGFGSTEPCTVYGGQDCWKPESSET